MSNPVIQVSHDDLLTALQDCYGRSLADAMGAQARFKAGLAVAEQMILSLQATIEELRSNLEQRDREIASLQGQVDSYVAVNRQLRDELDGLRNVASEAPSEVF